MPDRTAAARCAIIVLALAAGVSAILAGCRAGLSSPSARPGPVAAQETGPRAASAPAPSPTVAQAPPMPNKLPRGLSRHARKLLRANGFVVLGRDDHWSILDYGDLNYVFITSDAVLYVFHHLFQGDLAEYEKTHLLPLVRKLVAACLETAQQQYHALKDDELLSEPARRCVVFFAVADALLNDREAVVEKKAAAAYVRKVLQAKEIGSYPEEDWTLYRPRGAYADDPDLRCYFRAMKWLSRRIWPIIPGTLDHEPEASIKLRQAWLIGQMLHEHSQLAELWRQLYDEISFFCDRPDSFTPLQLFEVASKFGSRPDDAWLRAVRSEFARPEYLESATVSVRQGNPGDAPRKYVQFIAERYIPDGEVLQRVCFPYTGRTIPEGLDVAFTLFGSDRAHDHLAAEGFATEACEKQWSELREKLGHYGDEANPRTVYAGWVGALRALAHPPMTRRTPPFMATPAWQDKCLNTTLASWAQMRHDFILYAKHPVIPAGMNSAVYVEPVPDFYRRIGAVSSLLADRGFVGMKELSALCSDLAAAADAELAGGKEKLRSKLGTERIMGFYIWLLENFQGHVAKERPCIIADVATDTNTHTVVHVATGPLNRIVIYAPAYYDPAKFMFYEGLALSYYELRLKDKRLTDAEWEKMVKRRRHRRYRPWWTRSFLADVRLPSPPQQPRRTAAK